MDLPRAGATLTVAQATVVVAGGPGRATRRRRWGRRVGLCVVAAVLVLALAGLPCYVFPAQSAPRADAEVVVVLGPAQWWRIEWAMSIAKRSGAPILLSSPEPDTAKVCHADLGVQFICFRPDPFTTRGEARELRDQMAAHGWTTAVVVTTTPHITRTRYILGRCVSSGVQVVGRAPGMSPWRWVYQYVYQSGGWLRALAQSGC